MLIIYFHDNIYIFYYIVFCNCFIYLSSDMYIIELKSKVYFSILYFFSISINARVFYPMFRLMINNYIIYSFFFIIEVTICNMNTLLWLFIIYYVYFYNRFLFIIVALFDHMNVSIICHCILCDVNYLIRLFTLSPNFICIFFATFSFLMKYRILALVIIFHCTFSFFFFLHTSHVIIMIFLIPIFIFFNSNSIPI